MSFHESNAPGSSPDIPRKKAAEGEAGLLSETSKQNGLPGNSARPSATSLNECKEKLPERRTDADAAGNDFSQALTDVRHRTKHKGDCKPYGTDNAGTLQNNTYGKEALNTPVSAKCTKLDTEESQSSESSVRNAIKGRGKEGENRRKLKPESTSQDSDTTQLQKRKKNKERTQTSKNTKGDQNMTDVAVEENGVLVSHSKKGTEIIPSNASFSSDSNEEDREAYGGSSPVEVMENHPYKFRGKGTKHISKPAEATELKINSCGSPQINNVEHLIPVERSKEYRRGNKSTSPSNAHRKMKDWHATGKCKQKDSAKGEAGYAATSANDIQDASRRRVCEHSNESRAPQPPRNIENNVMEASAAEVLGMSQSVSEQNEYDDNILYRIECPLRSDSFD